MVQKKLTDETKSDELQEKSDDCQDKDGAAQSQECCGWPPFGCRPCPPHPCCCTGATGPSGATGPKGDTGTCEECGMTTQLLSTYSNPPQQGSDGGKLVFDRNGVTNGTAISHTINGTDIVISQPGFYFVTFHGTLLPAQEVDFPLTILLFLQQQGNQVPGTAVQYTFQTSSETVNVSFSQMIRVDTVPNVLELISQGGNFFYSAVNMTIQKISKLPEV